MDWDCDHCSFRNKGTTSRCRVCHLKSHQQRSSLMSTSLVEISCPRCTLLNPQNSSSCEVCGHTFLPKEKNPSPLSRSSSSNDENRSGSEEEDDESDCEEKMLFELISEQIDEFVETIKQSNEIRYRCKFDGRICGTKSIMCAYVARRHKAAALEQLKKKESRDRKRDGVQSDEALAWKLAILDSQIVATNGKGGRKRPQTGGTTLRSTSLPSSSSSRRTVPVLPPKTEPRKKREYTPLPPSAYFRNREQQTASAATVAPKTLKPKVEFSLSHEDKETRLKKLLQKSDQIVSRLAQLIPAPPTSAQTSDQTTTTQPPLASSYPSHSVEHTDTETPCSLPGDPVEVSDPSIINDSDRNPTVPPTLIEYPLLQGCTLRSYQSAGVEWLCGLHDAGLNGILADEMGLGKTLQVITFFCCLLQRYHLPGPHLIVMPLSVLSSWKEDISRYCPTIKPYVHLGNQEERETNFRQWFQMLQSLRSSSDNKIDICLTTYDMALKDSSLFTLLSGKRQQSRRSSSSNPSVSWSYIVVDEAHRLKNSGSKLYATLRELECVTTTRHLLLTGTPLQNNLKELWSLLHFILPSVFSDFEEFNDWFNKPFDSIDDPTLTSRKKNVRKKNLMKPKDSSRSQDLTEEERALIVSSLHRVLKPFILRRLKIDVAADLPKKIEKVIFCPFSELQLASYRSVLVQVYESQNINALSFSSSSSRPPSSSSSSIHFTKLSNLNSNNTLMQLRKISNHPYLTLEDCKCIPDDLYDRYLTSSSGKLTILSLFLDYLIPNGHKVLIFCQMTTMLDILEGYLHQRGYPCYRLDGRTDRDTRDHIIREFHKDPLRDRDRDRNRNRDGNNFNSLSPASVSRRGKGRGEEGEEEQEEEEEEEETENDEIADDDFDQSKVESASIFLLSTRAGGVGINLQSADTVILYDSDWNPQADLQAIGRAHRIGQKNNVLILRLVSVNHRQISAQDPDTSVETTVDPIKDFLSIEERMLLRATGKLEAEKAILARKQFDLSSLSAEVDLKSIMETLTKLPKEESAQCDTSSFYLCDEIVNLANGSQLIDGVDDAVLVDICERRTIESCATGDLAKIADDQELGSSEKQDHDLDEKQDHDLDEKQDKCREQMIQSPEDQSLNKESHSIQEGEEKGECLEQVKPQEQVNESEDNRIVQNQDACEQTWQEPNLMAQQDALDVRPEQVKDQDQQQSREDQGEQDEEGMELQTQDLDQHQRQSDQSSEKNPQEYLGENETERVVEEEKEEGMEQINQQDHPQEHGQEADCELEERMEQQDHDVDQDESRVPCGQQPNENEDQTQQELHGRACEEKKEERMEQVEGQGQSQVLTEKLNDNEVVLTSESRKPKSIMLMRTEDLESWKDWFTKSDADLGAGQGSQSEIQYNEQGRGIRRSRSTVSHSETELWKQALLKAELSPADSLTSTRRSSSLKTTKATPGEKKNNGKGNRTGRRNQNQRKKPKGMTPVVEDGEDEDEDGDVCAICGEECVDEADDEKVHDHGLLLLCDGCDHAFHLKCVGLTRVPAGDWYCHLCRHTTDPSSTPASSSSSSTKQRSIRIKQEPITRSFSVPVLVPRAAPGASDDLVKKRKRCSDMEDDEIIVLTDSDSDEEEDEEEKAPVVPITKRHKCTLCGLPVSDFNDLQLHLVMDCVEWKKINEQNQNSSEAVETVTSYLPAALVRAYTNPS